MCLQDESLPRIHITRSGIDSYASRERACEDDRVDEQRDSERSSTLGAFRLRDDLSVQLGPVRRLNRAADTWAIQVLQSIESGVQAGKLRRGGVVRGPDDLQPRVRDDEAGCDVRA